MQGCAVAQIDPEIWDIIQWAGDWELGHTPVTLGRALWVPAKFIHAMRSVRDARIVHERDRIRRRQEDGRG